VDPLADGIDLVYPTSHPIAHTHPVAAVVVLQAEHLITLLKHTSLVLDRRPGDVAHLEAPLPGHLIQEVHVDMPPAEQ
jgi:hypothetical protein